MPRGDGTGPNGEGPRTGRGLGSCPPKNKKTTPQTPSGRGRRGGGRFGLRDGTGPRSK